LYLHRNRMVPCYFINRIFTFVPISFSHSSLNHFSNRTSKMISNSFHQFFLRSSVSIWSTLNIESGSVHAAVKETSAYMPPLTLWLTAGRPLRKAKRGRGMNDSRLEIWRCCAAQGWWKNSRKEAIKSYVPHGQIVTTVYRSTWRSVRR
jgi:hypothetical protein